MDINNDFIYSTLQLGADYEGSVISTLISSKYNKGNRKSVLYIHGYIDYFFQPHLCEQFHDNNFDFYALDLRKYGRSLLLHQTPNYCEHIEEYFEEITESIKNISEKSTETYLLGHSTGGLISACYMNRGELKDSIVGLILNSPFLDMPQASMATYILYPIVKLISKIKRDVKLKGVLSPVYVESIHEDYKGEWKFDLNWKPLDGFDLYFKWYIAIVDAQRSLKHSDIKVPVLLLHSSQSLRSKYYTQKVTSADIVLNIEDMKRIGCLLGSEITLLEVKNGLHDLFLSRKRVREDAFEKMFKWLNTEDVFS